LVLDGTGRTLGKTRPIRGYRGPVVTASGIGASQTVQTMAVGTGRKTSRVQVYADGSLTPTASFQAFGGKLGRGVSLAVGALGSDGNAVIAAGSRAAGSADVRLFRPDGTLLREFKDVLPGTLFSGVNVAIGDVNGDNYDDLIVAAGKGSVPVVTALDGREIAAGAVNPAKLFTFVAGGGAAAGAKVAVGYVAPGTVPSYLANIITTPEIGAEAGTVEVWNPADLGGSDTMDHSSMSAMSVDAGMDMSMDMDHDEVMQTLAASTSTSTSTPTPMAQFRPFGSIPGAVEIATSYLGNPGVPVITSWLTPRAIAFSTINMDNQVSTGIAVEGNE
jgi:hypothetical protein